jgi:hypothetical protein
METKYYQGKSKDKHDATELMAFVGVVGVGVSLLMYFTFLMFMVGCKVPDNPKPVSVTKLHYSTTIQPQPNGSTLFPKILPILK